MLYMTMWLEDGGLEMQFRMCDRDTKYSAALDRLVVSEGASTIRSPNRSAITRSYTESWIGSLKREYLNRFLRLGLKHFDQTVQEYAGDYNRFRFRQGLSNRPADDEDGPVLICPSAEVGQIKRCLILGGLLSHYERKAV